MPKKLGILVLVLSTLFLLAFQNSARGQFVLLYQKDGTAAGNYLGVSVASAGDVNGDGRADFIIGAGGADPGGLGDAGSAFVYSGTDGSLLLQKNGASAGDDFGFGAAGAGDVNGDGRADFIIGAFHADPGGLLDAGSAYVYSGADGSLLFQKNGAAAGDELGYPVAGAGDVNGDGGADFIIGARGADPGGLSGAGSAYVYSGATGALLYQKNGAAPNDLFGQFADGAGDVNGDGRADFIIGANGADPGGLSAAGSAFVYSGADGSLLLQKNGASAGDNFGFGAAGAGDVNGDGRADFLVGAPYADPGGLSRAGSVYVYSGATGSLLFQKDGAAIEDLLGLFADGAGDVSGDGRADFIVGAYQADPGGITDAGSAFLYSGADGSLLYQKNGAAAFDKLGSVASAGDVNGDGRADFIIGVALADPGGITDAGSAFVYGMTGCAAAKGDMNADASLTAADVVLMLNCAFLGTGTCNLCFSDVNCDGILTAADVVAELNYVFLGIPPAGCP